MTSATPSGKPSSAATAPRASPGYIRDSNGKVTDQFRRALRGEAVLQPRDLAYAIHHFGDDLDVSSLLAAASA